MKTAFILLMYVTGGVPTPSDTVMLPPAIFPTEAACHSAAENAYDTMVSPIDMYSWQHQCVEVEDRRGKMA